MMSLRKMKDDNGQMVIIHGQLIMFKISREKKKRG
jgi:hypothetical protein